MIIINFFREIKEVQDQTGTKHNQIFRLNKDYALILKSTKEGIEAVVSVIDDSVAEELSKYSIYQDKHRPGPRLRVFTEIGTERLTKIVLQAFGVEDTGENIHHNVFYRENRRVYLTPIDHSKHSKLPPRKIRTDKQFIGYLREEVLQVSVIDFHRIMLDLYELGRMYKSYSLIELTGIDILTTPLEEFKDNLQNHIIV